MQKNTLENFFLETIFNARLVTSVGLQYLPFLHNKTTFTVFPLSITNINLIRLSCIINSKDQKSRSIGITIKKCEVECTVSVYMCYTVFMQTG